MKKNWKILFIIFFSFLLNSFYLEWGLPLKWHPDEELYVDDIIRMATDRKFRTDLPVFSIALSFFRFFLYFIFINIGTYINFNFNIGLVYLLFRYCCSIIATLNVYVIYIS